MLDGWVDRGWEGDVVDDVYISLRSILLAKRCSGSGNCISFSVFLTLSPTLVNIHSTDSRTHLRVKRPQAVRRCLWTAYRCEVDTFGEAGRIILSIF